MYGTAGNDMIVTLGGGHAIFGQGENDTICTESDGPLGDGISGGTGDDYIEAGGRKDLIESNDGADHIVGGAGNGTIDGGSGRDTLEGGGDFAADDLRGGRDDDYLNGGSSIFDTGDGQDGVDTCVDILYRRKTSCSH